jgi:hypothetical protein
MWGMDAMDDRLKGESTRIMHLHPGSKLLTSRILGDGTTEMVVGGIGQMDVLDFMSNNPDVVVCRLCADADGSIKLVAVLKPDNRYPRVRSVQFAFVLVLFMACLLLLVSTLWEGASLWTIKDGCVVGIKYWE